MRCRYIAIFLVCLCMTQVCTETSDKSYQDEEAPPTKNDPSWLQTILWFPLSVTDAFPAADDEDSFEIPSEICGDGEENILVTAFRTVDDWLSRLLRLLIENVCIPGSWSRYYLHDNWSRGVWKYFQTQTQALGTLVSVLRKSGSDVITYAIQIYSAPLTWLASATPVSKQSCPLSRVIQLADDYMTTALKLVTGMYHDLNVWFTAISTAAYVCFLRYVIAMATAISCIKYLYKTGKQSMFGRGKSGDEKRTRISKDIPIHMDRHYPMCEYFDARPCNCGGTGEVKEIANHFPMCERYDGLPCNCGGKRDKPRTGTKQLPTDISGNSAVAGMYHDSQKKAHTENSHQGMETSKSPKKVQSSKQLKVSFSDLKENGPPLSTNNDKQESAQSSFPYLQTQGGIVNMVNIPVIPSGDLRPLTKASLELQLDSSCFDENFGTENEEATHDLNGSLASDIGHPRWNSSFREEPSFTSHNSSFSDRDLLAGGDGVSSAILTRRSPYKEVGVSFDENMVVTDNSDSLLDMTSFVDASNTSNSMSFYQDSSIFEMSLTFILRKVILMAMNLVHHKAASGNWNVMGTMETFSNKRYLYLMVPKNRRKNQNSSWLSRNNSASFRDEELVENTGAHSSCTAGEERDSRNVEFYDNTMTKLGEMGRSVQIDEREQTSIEQNPVIVLANDAKNTTDLTESTRKNFGRRLVTSTQNKLACQKE